jgi:hypothetical protein
LICGGPTDQLAESNDALLHPTRWLPRGGGSSLRTKLAALMNAKHHQSDGKSWPEDAEKNDVDLLVRGAGDPSQPNEKLHAKIEHRIHSITLASRFPYCLSQAI